MDEPEEVKEVCGESYDHTWYPGDFECRECYADLSHWNDEEEEENRGSA